MTEAKDNRERRQVAVIGDDDLRDTLRIVLSRMDELQIVLWDVHRMAIDEGDDVRVLLNAAAIAQVAQHRHMRRTLLRRARELRAGDDGDIQPSSQALERT